MRVHIFGLFVIAGLMLVFSGVGLNLDSVGAQQAMVKMGREFSVNAGQQVKLDGEDVTLKFIGVREDSRCPSNVNCIWAGNAEVALKLVHNKCATVLNLHTNPRSPASNQGKVSGFVVQLVKLDPYPHTERKISPSDYVATFLVGKE